MTDENVTVIEVVGAEGLVMTVGAVGVARVTLLTTRVNVAVGVPVTPLAVIV